MPKISHYYASCGACKFCCAGGRVHGPYLQKWDPRPDGRTHRHVSGGLPDGAFVPPLPEGGSDPVGEAVIGYFSLPEERQEQIEETLRVKARAKSLKRSAVSEAVESFTGREGREPYANERKEIASEVERNADRTLRSALKKARELSGKLTKWRIREREKRERDEAAYERDRIRYEALALREIEYDQRRRLYAAINEIGGLRTNDALREEYRGIPNAYKSRDGLAGDELASILAGQFPEFGIRDERDLMDFFRDSEAA